METNLMFSVAGEWCQDCMRYIASEEISEGKCPNCGTLLREEKVPWHFKLLLLALTLYLSYRLVQGVVWLIHHFS